MNDSSNEQGDEMVDEILSEEALTVLPENNAYFRLRRTALLSTIFLVIFIFIILLYLNGRSLYEHGL